MALQLSTTVRNARADQAETTIGTSPKLQIYTGPPPANCAAAATGTKLVEMTLPSDWMAAAASGSKAMSGSWTGTGSALGFAGYFRITNSAGTTCHMQGTVGQAWAASTAYLVGHRVNNGGNNYVCTTAGTSASSGGPTTTGASISDGTCVWSYVATAEMTIDNDNINTGQPVTVNSFSWTEANP